MSTEKPDLLILAAYEPELSGLRSALGTTLSGTIGSLHVVCRTVGVGLPVAGGGTLQCLHDTAPRAVLLLGSCGLYPGSEPFEPLVPVVPKRIRLIDASELNGHAAFPAPPMKVSFDTDAALCDGLAQAEENVIRGELATTLSITTDDALAKRIAEQSECAAENLEAFAVGLACADLPFAALLIATNEVGSNGRKQWQQHHLHAAERGARLLLTWIANGARGLRTRGGV